MGHNEPMTSEKNGLRLMAAALMAVGVLFTGCGEDEIEIEQQRPERNVEPGLRPEGTPREEEN